MGVFSRGTETSQPSQQERANQQSRDRMTDANDSTRPGEVTLSDLKRK